MNSFYGFYLLIVLNRCTPEDKLLGSCNKSSVQIFFFFLKEVYDFVAGTANTVQAGIQSTTTVPDSSSNHPESDLDSMYLLLDSHLRPATPDMEDPKSVALFEEHKQLAQDYLKVSCHRKW